MTKFASSGALFVNDRAKNNKNAPTYQGALEIDEELANYIYDKIKEDGVERVKLELSAWKKSKDGKTWLSLSPQIPFRDRDPRSAPRRETVRQLDAFDDDIPF